MTDERLEVGDGDARAGGTSSVDCRACGWSGTVRVYRTLVTETWVCPRCLAAMETPRPVLISHGG